MSDLVVTKTFLSRHEAELAKSLLHAAGIESMISSDDFGGLRPNLAFGGGVRLLVKKKDVEKAQGILGVSYVFSDPEDKKIEALKLQRRTKNTKFISMVVVATPFIMLLLSFVAEFAFGISEIKGKIVFVLIGTGFFVLPTVGLTLSQGTERQIREALKEQRSLKKQK